jgi:8-oxo-dGTP diphosphatase
MQVVTAAVIRKSGKVLLTRRCPGDKLQGFWEFPGGKVECGESLESCLERELGEELGVESKVNGILCSSEYLYDSGAIKLIALDTTLSSDEFILTAHDKTEWVEPEALLSYNLLPADVPVAKFILSIDLE